MAPVSPLNSPTLFLSWNLGFKLRVDGPFQYCNTKIHFVHIKRTFRLLSWSKVMRQLFFFTVSVESCQQQTNCSGRRLGLLRLPVARRRAEGQGSAGRGGARGERLDGGRVALVWTLERGWRSSARRMRCPRLIESSHGRWLGRCTLCSILVADYEEMLNEGVWSLSFLWILQFFLPESLRNLCKFEIERLEF